MGDVSPLARRGVGGRFARREGVEGDLTELREHAFAFVQVGDVARISSLKVYPIPEKYMPGMPKFPFLMM